MPYCSFRRKPERRLPGLTALASLLMLLTAGTVLSGCASDDDGDNWSVSAPVSAGQAIRLDSVPSHEPASVYRLTYRSTDARNPQQLVRVSAQVLVPRGRAPAGGWPVLAWAHGESGLHLTCAPSVMGIGTVQAHFYDGWLRQGFAIVATDYPGMGEPGAPLLLNARSEGMSVLDAVRAARERLPDLSESVVLNGHAQGGQAVLAAAAMASTYAPHLRILGTIAAAPPYLDEQTAQELLHPANPRSFSPAVPELLTLGQSLAEADPSTDINEAFTPRGQRLLHDAGSMCASDFLPIAKRSGLTPATLLEPEASRVLAPVFDWAKYPGFSLPSPVLIESGAQDLHTSPSQQKRLVTRLCAAGTAVTHRIHDASHNGTLAAMITEAHSFAGQLLQGTKPRSDCN
ncbi:lipase family protein [Gluconobacter sp. P1C6_b]|uniref:lipase family protein n=1 Tax=Gluconobacter sp. P1C6_b TaxID=2762619 RepID=UPI001C03C714|nr:lipase family protein [Gluconobacter sp. P1C6_b]